MIPPRLAPEWPLPPYTFVPGQRPHPMSHPQGHRFATHLVVATPLPDDFGEAFRLGLDLFHHGFYWEAHESWEKLWHAAGRTGSEADFFKALIHLAAAGVKALEGVARGVVDHARRAETLFQSLLERGLQEMGGLQLAACVAHSRSAAASSPTPTTDDIVLPVFDFCLIPNKTS